MVVKWVLLSAAAALALGCGGAERPSLPSPSGGVEQPAKLAAPHDDSSHPGDHHAAHHPDHDAKDHGAADARASTPAPAPLGHRFERAEQWTTIFDDPGRD